MNTSSEKYLEKHLVAQVGAQREFFWHRLRWRAVRRFLPAGDCTFSVLDIGAGAGFAGEYLRDGYFAAQYAFVEPIAALRASLAGRFGVDRDWTDRPNESAHYALLLDVLEHQADDSAFLRQISSRFKRRLIVTVPAHQWLWSSWDEKLGHFRRYSRSELIRAGERAGLRCVESRYLFQEMIVPALVRRVVTPDVANESSAENGAEFPALSKFTNALAYRFGVLTQETLKWVPAGTSVVAVFERSPT